MLGASHFWGPRTWISKHSFTGFHVLRLLTMQQNCRAFWLVPLTYSLRTLTTLAFIILEWLTRIEPKSTTLYDPWIRSKSLHPWASTDIFPRVGNVEILLILFRLLTMQCEWTFTKRSTLSTPLDYAGWTSILNL